MASACREYSELGIENLVFNRRNIAFGMRAEQAGGGRKNEHFSLQLLEIVHSYLRRASGHDFGSSFVTAA
jgi:hypothetical protein